MSYDLNALAARIQSEKGLALTGRDVERTLAAVASCEDIWRVIELAQVPLIALCAVLEALAELGWLRFQESRVALTAQGEKAVEELGVRAVRELRCPRCGGRGLELEALRSVAVRFHQLVQDRPPASQEFDQGYITEESALARVAMMWRRGDLEGKDLLVVGDDDLVSLAAALTGLPRRVAMVDIDPRLVEFVSKAAHEEGLNVEAHLHDLRQPLPAGLRKKFHTFACDPTESLRGFLAFARRGISALAGVGCAGYLGLTRVEASLSKWRAIQEELLRFGAVITDLVQDFHTYENWPYLEAMRGWSFMPARRVPGKHEFWYRSALMRIELVELGELPDEVLLGDIFEDEEAATT